MKAFFIGLIFLVAAGIFTSLVVLLYPLLFVLGLVLRFVIFLALCVFLIWVLGKLIIFTWESLTR